MKAMKKTHFASALAILFTVFSATAVHGGEVIYRVWMEKSAYVDGEDIPIQRALRNETNRKVGLMLSDFGLDHEVVIHSDDGEKPELTEFGKTDFDKTRSYVLITHRIAVDLEPVAAEFRIPTILLNKLYRLHPGKYFVTLFYRSATCYGFSGAMLSNTLEIEIIPSTKSSSK